MRRLIVVCVALFAMYFTVGFGIEAFRRAFAPLALMMSAGLVCVAAVWLLYQLDKSENLDATWNHWAQRRRERRRERANEIEGLARTAEAD